MNRISHTRKSSSAYTFAELLMGILITSAVALVCFGSSVTLQKGFSFITTWSDVRNSMLRVADTIEIDLRNATQVTISAPTNNRQTLTLKIPDHYQNYYPSSSPRAGEPNAAISSGTYSSTLGAITTGATMTVVYSWSAYGTTGQQLIRSGTWVSTTGTTQTASRTVATFTYSPNVSYLVLTTGTSGSVTTGTAVAATLSTASTPGVCIQISGSYGVFGTYRQTGTLQSVVNLRALNVL